MLAPYADLAIPLSLSSITGLKYRTLNCFECGQPFMERNAETMYRMTDDMPKEAHVGTDGAIAGMCGNCSQKYSVTISVALEPAFDNVPLYMQPQTLFITTEPVKKLRDTFCMECGKAFYSISDRIKSVVDNTIPTEMLDPNKLGPMEVWCHFHRCKQRWSVFV